MNELAEVAHEVPLRFVVPRAQPVDVGGVERLEVHSFVIPVSTDLGQVYTGMVGRAVAWAEGTVKNVPGDATIAGFGFTTLSCEEPIALPHVTLATISLCGSYSGATPPRRHGELQ